MHLRYGFNGKEHDSEAKGWQNQYDYGARVYDPRIGRFLSVDPLTKKYPELTPYQFASNRPIDGIDLDGLEWSKSDLQFFAPDGRYHRTYTVKLSLNNSLNLLKLSNSADKAILDLYARGAEKILNEQKYSGTKEDPVLHFKIEFNDDANSTYKMAFYQQDIYIEMNRKQDDPLPEAPYNGITENIGDIFNNRVGIITSQRFTLTQNGKFVRLSVVLRKPDEIFRTIAHELMHTLGLRHPDDPKGNNGDVSNTDVLGPLAPIRTPEDILNNLLNSAGNKSYPSNTGKELLPSQRKKINETMVNAPKTEN